MACVEPKLLVVVVMNTYTVVCRVAGDPEIHTYHVTAPDYETARKNVVDEVVGCTVALVKVVG